MNGNLKIIGSNNKYTPLGLETSGELIANKLIVNSREENVPNQVFTLDINNVIIYDKHVHVDAWFVNEELNGGRVEFKLTWT
tara:strand:+ start:19 stop:264 length:246 start_codon:yes stop_codon:yes gene_type:complete